MLLSEALHPPLHPPLSPFPLPSTALVFVRLYHTHAKAHLKPTETLIQLTSKEHERTLKLKVPLAVATRLPWWQYLCVKLLRLEPAVPTFMFLEWADLRGRKTSPLFPVSPALLGRVMKLFRSFCCQRGVGVPAISTDPFNWTE